MQDYLSIHPEVADALKERRPVVALESTIIAHGMPHPANVETARAVEAIVRAEGAVPATVAVLDGRIRVGLDAEDLERLGTDPAIAKLSRRDLPMALAMGSDGATTVATTMIAARLAGIALFVTGGIGGVHRDAFDPAGPTLDVSADLQELAQSDVAVVCAGAKSVLDLPKTLEYLETHGVPVIGYGTDRFPAFYTGDSGLAVPHRLDDPAAVARAMRAKWQLGLQGGIVVANPIPAEDAVDVSDAIATALGEARAQGVRGKAVTPFLLARIAELTEGRSLKANVALVKANAAVGARIAVAYAAMQRDGRVLPPRIQGVRQRM